MHATLTPTSLVCSGNAGISFRVWKGTTDDGTPLHALVLTVSCDPKDSPAFERWLTQAKPAPTSVEYAVAECWLNESGISYMKLDPGGPGPIGRPSNN